MTVEQYLSQIKMLEFKIDRKRDKARELKLKAMSITSPRYGDKVQASRQQGSALETAVERYVMLYDSIELERVALEEKKADITARLEQLEDFRLYQVLTFRYIDCLKFEEIADKMSYSLRQVRRLHTKALQAFEENNQDIFLNAENTEQNAKRTA